MSHIDVLESLLAQIHELSAPRPRISVTRTAEQLADQLIEALGLYPEHHSVLVSTLMDYAAQEHGWRPGNKPPPPMHGQSSIDVPAAVSVMGDIEYSFVVYRHDIGQWRTRQGSPIMVLYWYDLPMLPE